MGYVVNRPSGFFCAQANVCVFGPVEYSFVEQAYGIEGFAPYYLACTNDVCGVGDRVGELYRFRGETEFASYYVADFAYQAGIWLERVLEFACSRAQGASGYCGERVLVEVSDKGVYCLFRGLGVVVEQQDVSAFCAAYAVVARPSHSEVPGQQDGVY